MGKQMQMLDPILVAAETELRDLQRLHDEQGQAEVNSLEDSKDLRSEEKTEAYQICQQVEIPFLCVL